MVLHASQNTVFYAGMPCRMGSDNVFSVKKH